MKFFVLICSLVASATCVAGPFDQAFPAPPKPSEEWGSKPNAEVDPLAAATVVVYNDNDPISVNLARTYAEKRGIPLDHLIGVGAPLQETITRAEYDKCIAEPLRKAFIKRGWWKVQVGRDGVTVNASCIHFVALMRGIPLRIATVSDYPGNNPKPGGSDAISSHNEASVDSELAVLGMFTQQISGAIKNFYFRAFAPIADAPLPTMLLVCRLDAATPRTVLSMIDTSIEVEKTGLWGFAYVDARNITSGVLKEGDDWMRQIRDDTMKHGIPCIFDNSPSLIPEHYPMRNAALYFGWYSEQVDGVFKNDQLRLAPGSIAVHIHSFSADSLRLPLRNWCAPLLERGAVATLGNVYEPYLSLTPNLGIFEERLRNGMTFAEAAYASIPVL